MGQAHVLGGPAVLAAYGGNLEPDLAATQHVRYDAVLLSERGPWWARRAEPVCPAHLPIHPPTYFRRRRRRRWSHRAAGRGRPPPPGPAGPGRPGPAPGETGSLSY